MLQRLPSLLAAVTITVGASAEAQWARLCLPTRETRVCPLGWADALGKKMAMRSVLLPGKSHGQRGVTGYGARGGKGQTWLRDVVSGGQRGGEEGD